MCAFEIMEACCCNEDRQWMNETKTSVLQTSELIMLDLTLMAPQSRSRRWRDV